MEHAQPTIEDVRRLADLDKPGRRDDKCFIQGESVAYWRQLRPPNKASDMRALLRSAASRVARDSMADHRLLGLWMYSVTRASFFQALNTTAKVAARLGRSRMAMGMGTGINAKANESASGTHEKEKKNAATSSSGVMTSSPFSPRLVAETWHALRDDVRRVRDGVHNAPWLATPSYAAVAAAPVNAARSVGQLANAGVSMLQSILTGEAGKVWLRGDTYPEYYRFPFHFQTDGWLSSASADAYDALTETLFCGRQDAMQRVTLHALSDFIFSNPTSTRTRTRATANTGMKMEMINGNSARVRTPVIVEMGAGTGRFSTFVRDNFRNAELHVTDLSPFYLEKARDYMHEWHRVVQPDTGSLGETHFIQANAERLPLDTASVDVVYSVYLMHELPPHARRAVIAEAARLLRPGGMFVLTDSVQLGDRPAWDQNIGMFGNFSEPWFLSYVMQDFAELVTQDKKFRPYRKELCSATKMLSFIRLEN